MDDTYQIYSNRVLRLTALESYRSQVHHIQESPKFQSQGAGRERQPVPFPGYTVITPPWADEPANVNFYEALRSLQQQLLDQTPPDLIVPLPPESFHLTLADLLWDSAYRYASQDPAFESLLHQRMGEIFKQYQEVYKSPQSVYWSSPGLVLMPRAIGVCLVPRDETSYWPIFHLRQLLYQSQGLIALGVEQQYHFTGHVTLGYFGSVPDDFDGEDFCQTLVELNQTWLEEGLPELQILQAELRKFDNMVHYYRESDWPTLSF